MRLLRVGSPGDESPAVEHEGTIFDVSTSRTMIAVALGASLALGGCTTKAAPAAASSCKVPSIARFWRWFRPRPARHRPRADR